MSQLTTVDATFLNAETGTTHAHIAGLGIVDAASCPDGRLTVEGVAELVRSRAHLAARPLRQRLVQVPFGLDRPYWEDDPDFDPGRHIFEIGLPAPGDDRQLADVVAMLHEQPLDRSRPLWEMFLIQGLIGGRTAVYVKVHHAAIDGVTAAETLAALLDLSPEPRDVPADETEPARAPRPAEMVRAGLLNTAMHPVRSALSVARAAPYLDEIPGLSSLPGVGLMSSVVQGALRRREVPRAPRMSAPPTPFNQPIGRRRSVACGELPLDDIKQIRRGLGGSVNDVVMALCATALRQWLDKRGELPERPLVAAVPVSLRRRGNRGDGGNQVSVMATPLATDVPDPADRYAAVRRDMDRAKRRFTGSSGSWVQDMSGLIPAPVAGALTRLALQAAPAMSLRPINLIVSNVPGPQFPLYLCGARVLGYYPISVITDITGGLNITVFSYDGKVDVGIVACRELIPDPSEIVDHLVDALDELRELSREALEERALEEQERVLSGE
ncbi:WS/DGAT/MGAT family O-acyltransferase [Actinomadura decatromicini]|uniref:Diacylglycerol O-acyltransferase n=1 Tax=Actinomadura decatromicini TaxID=2604572 RepID=A0A5D3FVM1_9ACTN|nr:wax ester/triacylglycerol synthase family O-acyltransferase [Actinomadura decatromicini]TYK52907.1 wax ester/triacylglycerol synthase family O-acyltransferase [Actinomadura decatromicini]